MDTEQGAVEAPEYHASKEFPEDGRRSGPIRKVPAKLRCGQNGR